MKPIKNYDPDKVRKNTNFRPPSSLTHRSAWQIEHENFLMDVRLTGRSLDPNVSDKFRCVITEPGNCRAEIRTDYEMGSGPRWYPRNSETPFGGLSAYGWENSVVLPPTVPQVLEGLALDYRIAEELPRDTAGALDYLAADLGFERPGEAYKVLQTLQEFHGKFESFLHAIKRDAADFITD